MTFTFVGVSLGTTCITEMGDMMECWRNNSFEDPPCKKEIDMFLHCSYKVVSVHHNFMKKTNLVAGARFFLVSQPSEVSMENSW